MGHIFKNKAKDLCDNISYYKTSNGKRLFNGKLRRGCYYFCEKINYDYLRKCDNVIFLYSLHEYAPQIKHKVIFVFD